MGQDDAKLASIEQTKANEVDGLKWRQTTVKTSSHWRGINMSREMRRSLGYLGTSTHPKWPWRKGGMWDNQILLTVNSSMQIARKELEEHFQSKKNLFWNQKNAKQSLLFIYLFITSAVNKPKISTGELFCHELISCAKKDIRGNYNDRKNLKPLGLFHDTAEMECLRTRVCIHGNNGYFEAIKTQIVSRNGSLILFVL